MPNKKVDKREKYKIDIMGRTFNVGSIYYKVKTNLQFLLMVVVIAYVIKTVRQSYKMRGPTTVYNIDIKAWRRLQIKDDDIEMGSSKINKDKPYTNQALKERINHALKKAKRQPDLADASYPVLRKGKRVPLKKNQPILLVWWPPAYLNSRKDFFLERNFQGVCGNCRLTTDRTLLHRANTLLFDNVPSLENINDMPPPRRPKQSYVLWNRETPAKVFHRKNLMEGVFDTMFNYTMSYHRSADIVWFLGNIQFTQLSMPRNYSDNPQQYIDEILDSKNHLAAWAVSNCNRTKGAVARRAYAHELVDAGLDIDLFGDCYNREVPRKDFSEFLSQYKFYLAFENSIHCKDYVTEKFWRNGLRSNTVPIVWGPSREDMKATAPPNSYIHVEDYESPQDLVNFLNYLDNNDAEYSKYFEWRKMPFLNDFPIQMMRPGYESGMCKLCRFIVENGGSLPPNVINSAKSWIFDTESDQKCLLYDVEN